MLAWWESVVATCRQPQVSNRVESYDWAFGRWWKSDDGQWRRCQINPFCNNQATESVVEKELSAAELGPARHGSLLPSGPLLRESAFKGPIPLSLTHHDETQLNVVQTERHLADCDVVDLGERSMSGFQEVLHTPHEIICQNPAAAWPALDGRLFIEVGVCHRTSTAEEHSFSHRTSYGITETPIDTPSCHTPSARSCDGLWTPSARSMSTSDRQALVELEVIQHKLRRNSIKLAVAQLDALQEILQENAFFLSSFKAQLKTEATEEEGHDVCQECGSLNDMPSCSELLMGGKLSL